MLNLHKLCILLFRISLYLLLLISVKEILKSSYSALLFYIYSCTSLTAIQFMFLVYFVIFFEDLAF